jgi:hypothetical protein
MRAPFAAALCTSVLLTGCGNGREQSAASPSTGARAVEPVTARSASEPAPDVRAALPRMARDLIPDGALRSIPPGALRVDECGISPTFPCTNVFFALEEGRGLTARLGSLRSLAESKGWRVEHVERFRTGAYLDLVREQFHARYTIGSGLMGPGVSEVRLSIFGPATELRRPSLGERESWSASKRRYVRDANAVCSRTLGTLADPGDVSKVVADAAEQLSALEPPPGEEEQVRSFIRPLKNLARSARALSDEEGEDVLPAVVGVGEFSKRFIEAASRYGLDKCVLG